MSEAALKKRNETVISMAVDMGADACDVISQSGRSFATSVQDGKLDKYKVSSAQLFGLRVIKDQRPGIAYSESADEESLRLMVKQAIENAKFAGEDVWQNIEVQRSEPCLDKNPKLFQDDQTSIEEKVALSLRLEKDLLAADKRIQSSPYNGYSDGDVEESYLNHLGTYGYRKERSFSCYTAALAGDQGKQAMYGHSSVARRFDQLKPELCISEAVRYVLPLIGAKSIPTGRYDVVFEVDQLESIFGAFHSNFSGKDVVEGKSRLREKLGSSVADARLSIVDDPSYSDGFYFSSFDDEGNPRQPLQLVRNGILQSFLHNSGTAKRLNTETTGHAARSPKSSLGVAGTQTIIQVGPDAEGSIFTGKYLKVINLKGLHSGTNPISGQFSLAVEGILMQAESEQQYVKDVTISGNFFELLNKVAAVGETLHANSSRTFFAPYIRFEGISLAGS